MKHDVQEPVGVVVTDVDLHDLSRGSVMELTTLLARHGVIVFPDQAIGDTEFAAFLRSFGDLAFTTGETPVEGHPDLNVISNLGRTTPPRSQFHVDSSYLRVPPAYTALRTVRIPERGGETLFTNQYAAYETLPEAVKQDLADRTITHVVTGLELGENDETEAQHPVFRPHPISGRMALYLSTPQRCAAVSRMGPEEAKQTVAFLYAHSTTEENTFRHAWSAGDVVMWDNSCVLHRADHSGVVGDRVMHRGMVAGG